METAVRVIAIVIAAIAVGALSFFVSGLPRQRRPQPGAQPGDQVGEQAPPPDPGKMRQEQLERTQRRAAEAESQSVYEETLLYLEEDADYYRQLTRQTREARRQRRQPSKDQH